MDFKEKYKQFKQWRRDGLSYVVEDLGVHECRCCGDHFHGNFCPKCGQNYKIRKLSWESVRVEALNVWGLGNRSMPYSIWQLLTRPGYFISDYINGKRQISFPPVKMIVIMGLFASLLEFLFETPSIIPKPANNSKLYFLSSFFKWCDSNEGWAMLIMCSFLIIPTWVLFRNSPRNRHHNLPEGFFIQAFMATLTTIIIIFDVLIDKLSWFVGAYFYFIAYRQLFGYKVWGTIWRMAFGFLVSFFTFWQMAFVSVMYGLAKRNVQDIHTWDVIIIIVFCILIDAFILFVGYLIDRRGGKTNKNSDAESKTMEAQAKTSVTEPAQAQVEPAQADLVPIINEAESMADKTEPQPAQDEPADNEAVRE